GALAAVIASSFHPPRTEWTSNIPPRVTLATHSLSTARATSPPRVPAGRGVRSKGTYACDAVARGPWTSSVGAEPKFAVRADAEVCASSLRRAITAPAGAGSAPTTAARTRSPLVAGRILQTVSRNGVLPWARFRPAGRLDRRRRFTGSIGHGR